MLLGAALPPGGCASASRAGIPLAALAPDNSCDISASVFLAGDEAFPHCVGEEPVRRAAALQGWRDYPYRYPVEDNVYRYGHADDNNILMFIPTLGDAGRFRNIYIVRTSLV
jgi:hypothetical protein